MDVAETISGIAETYSRGTYQGICVADGWGLSIKVERGHLIVSDGVGPHRRVRTYARATHGLTRLVVLGTAGMLTLDSLRRCIDLDIPVLVLDRHGVPLLASAPRVTDDARLRRAQAKAPEGPLGLDLAKVLLKAKITGQAHTLGATFVEVGTLDPSLASLDCATTIDECRAAEALGASAYFGAWCGDHVTPMFRPRDRSDVPSHWLTFEGRRSCLKSASSNRGAERPLNALLNYAYALLESEAVLACAAVGLDPGLGVVHQDARGRASFALDLMEPARPLVDQLILELVSSRTFKASEFLEDGKGHCRLRAPLTHELTELVLPKVREWVAPYAEKCAHMIGNAAVGKYIPSTPLTSARLRSAQTVIKARKTATQRPPVARQVAPYSCPDCASPVTNPRHVLCPACQLKKGHTPSVRQSRGRAISARKQALRSTTDALGAPLDREWYRSTILPYLPRHKLSAIQSATGHSKSTASSIRSGQHIPSSSTWPALLLLTQEPSS